MFNNAHYIQISEHSCYSIHLSSSIIFNDVLSRLRERSQQTKITTMTPIFVTSFLFFILSCSSRAQPARPDYIRCQNNLECESGYCCTIGPIRYSIPECRAMQKEGEICRPGSASAINMTVGYPDGALVTLTDVHYILCPCANGLSCDAKEGVCKDTGVERDTNRLFGEHNKRDD
uniref:uncharacterized protein LOC117604180 isoform X1 n=2 Tax=Osmia lignaria TaxID=473952 RepID=UPI001478BA3D|nr:uncharacterized protein LOC117604180 isoform X1 [Osmia lignaria]